MPKGHRSPGPPSSPPSLPRCPGPNPSCPGALTSLGFPAQEAWWRLSTNRGERAAAEGRAAATAVRGPGEDGGGGEDGRGAWCGRPCAALGSGSPAASGEGEGAGAPPGAPGGSGFQNHCSRNAALPVPRGPGGFLPAVY